MRAHVAVVAVWMAAFPQALRRRKGERDVAPIPAPIHAASGDSAAMVDGQYRWYIEDDAAAVGGRPQRLRWAADNQRAR